VIKTLGTVAAIGALGAGALLTQTGAQAANQVIDNYVDFYNNLRERYNRLTPIQRWGLRAALQQWVIYVDQNVISEMTKQKCHAALDNLDVIFRTADVVIPASITTLIQLTTDTCSVIRDVKDIVNLIITDLNTFARAPIPPAPNSPFE
jgi:hypothetical protein